jgi:hypothetical protein
VNIQEALKETGKARLEIQAEHFLYAFIAELNNSYVWLNKDGQHEYLYYDDGLREDWQPYHDKKVIRPEEAGELWACDGLGMCFVYYDKSLDLHLKWRDGAEQRVAVTNIAHNQNGWTRLYPPVEDDSVERVEFEYVECTKERESVYNVNSTFATYRSLPKRVRMILEYEKQS